MVKKSVIQPPPSRFKIVDFLWPKKDNNLTKNSAEYLAQMTQILSYLMNMSRKEINENLTFCKNVLVLCCKHLSKAELNEEIKLNQKTLLV